MKPLRYYMRSLHRDLGFFVIGLVVIYSLSGILLMFRNTDFMKREVQIERQLKPGMNATELSALLRLKGFKLNSENSEQIVFNTGKYEVESGLVSYTSREVIPPFNKFISLHRIADPGVTRTFMVVFGVILLFLAISSFWMFKPSSRHFQRGIILMVLGVLASALFLFL